MKKSAVKQGLFAFLVVLLFVSMVGFVSAFVSINEIMYDPSSSLQGGDTDLEWIEIFNNGTETVNLANWKINGTDFDDANITAGGYVVVARNLTDSSDNESFEAYYGNNDTVWNSTDASYTTVAGGFGTLLTNSGGVINISNGTYSYIIDYTPFVALFPDTANQGKTLIFYKGNFTESAFINGTPGASNDQFAPDFNKWITPSKNNSIFGGLVNITVNVTDATNVSSVLVNFNNTNFSMSQKNDLWYFLWNTSKNIDASYNITVNFNDTSGFSNNDTILHITIDNTKPNITAPITSANSRNYANPGFNFNASVNATDANLLNVTCTLGSITVANFSNEGNTYYCNLTSALIAATQTNKEQDFTINFNAIDNTNNTNTTTISFTTKYTTSVSLSPVNITISNLNQSDKIVEVNATLTNAGTSSMYDTGVILDSFPNGFANFTTVSYQSCSDNINSSQSCNVTFNVTIKGGASAGTYTIFWNANWTNNNLTAISIKGQNLPLPASKVTIGTNPQITAAKNISAIINHGQNSSLELSINSTGNADLQNVIATFSGSTLINSYVSLSPSSFASVSAGTNTTLNTTITIPKHTSPGNYTGTVQISASNAESRTILLAIEVPEDSSWTTKPTNVTVHKRTDNAGLTTTISINNSGNIGQKYAISSSGTFKSYVWDSSLNPSSIYVEKNTTGAINIYHLANGPLTTYDLVLTITSQNASAANNTYITLTRDDNNPFANITNPINNSFVKGNVDFKVNSTDLNLSNIEFYIGNELVLKDTNITRAFSWNTANGSYPDDVYTLKAIAYDSAGNFNTSIINATVNNTDDSPILIKNIPTIIIVEDNNSTILNLSLFFRTIEGDSMKYNFTKPNNVTVHITNTTQIANFTPDKDFTGVNNITFTAIDSSLNTTSSNLVLINVTNVNDAPTTPVLTSPQSGSNVTSFAGKATLMWGASADADNDATTYYIFVSNGSSNIKLNATTTATTLQLTNLGNNVVYYWNVLASDNSLNSSNSSIFSFTIIRDNNPIINKWTWNNTINISSTNTSPIVAENRTLNFTINASDPENNPINFTWFRDSVEISNVQNFTFDLTNNFTAAGTYTLKLIVADNNSNSASQEWQVTVANTNREPILDQIPSNNISEDSTLKFNITAFDPDGDSLTFTSNISSITFTSAANNSLATVNWTPTNDNVGNNTIQFIVSDGTKNDSMTMKITVNNTNDAPTIGSFFPSEANKSIAADTGSQKFNISISDVDKGDSVHVSWFINGTFIASFSNSINVDNPQPAKLEAEIVIANKTKGLYNISAIIGDSLITMVKSWLLVATADIVSENLTSPVLQLNESERQNATNVIINQSAFGGIDFGNNTLNFTGIIKLEDAFNISRGFVSVDTDMYPALKNKGASLLMKGLNFTKAPLIYLADEFESTAGSVICPDDVCTNRTYDSTNRILRFNVPHFSTYFTQTNTTNGAPIITSAAVKTAAENAKYNYNVKATDPDGDALIFSLITKPSGMSISSSTGVISWTPTATQLGSNNVTISVSDGSLTAQQSFNIIVGKGPRLIISDLDVKVDKKTDKGIQNNTKISREAVPGSKVEFKLEVENLFTNEEDLEIEDIGVEITIEDIDDGDDLDEDADEFDLKARKNEDVSVEFDIPLEVDEGIYDVVISVEGRDENQTTHEMLWNLELEVEKETHEIRMLKADVAPLTVSCQRQVALNSEIINTGIEDEDDVTLEITSLELGINSVTSGIELNEGTDDNRFTKQVTDSIGKDVPAGVYPVTFNTYYDDSLSDTKTVDLTVEDCELTKSVKEKVKEKRPEVEVIMPKVSVEKPESKIAKPSFKQTSEYKTLLAIIVIAFIGTAVFIVGGSYMLLKK